MKKKKVSAKKVQQVKKMLNQIKQKKVMPFGPSEINPDQVEVRTPMGRVGRQ